eukprot:GILJ01015144.1.p1 GENE.GILJ01015144.1~~GILJ01015144.1.p1  ORF type:complete len:938 (+),score=155.29 GILJ01015144.1:1-2814(+)
MGDPGFCKQKMGVESFRSVLARLQEVQGDALVDAYQDLFKLCQHEDNAESNEFLVKNNDIFVSVFLTHASTAEEDLLVCLLRNLGYFLNHEQLAPLYSATQISAVVQLLADIVLVGASKVAANLAVWCIGAQNLGQLLHAFVPRLVEVLLYALDNPFKSSTIELEALLGCKKLLSQFPADMSSRVSQWGSSVLKRLVSRAPKIREAAESVLRTCVSTSPSETIRALSQESAGMVVSSLLPLMHELLETRKEMFVVKLWGTTVAVTSVRLFKPEIINGLLKIMEFCLSSDIPAVRINSYKNWVHLIQAFRAKEGSLSKLKNVQLLMTPLRNCFSNESLSNVRHTGLSTWKYLVDCDPHSQPELFDELVLSPIRTLIHDKDLSIRDELIAWLSIKLLNRHPNAVTVFSEKNVTHATTHLLHLFKTVDWKQAQPRSFCNLWSALLFIGESSSAVNVREAVMSLQWMIHHAFAIQEHSFLVDLLPGMLGHLFSSKCYSSLAGSTSCQFTDNLTKTHGLTAVEYLLLTVSRIPYVAADVTAITLQVLSQCLYDLFSHISAWKSDLLQDLEDDARNRFFLLITVVMEAAYRLNSLLHAPGLTIADAEIAAVDSRIASIVDRVFRSLEDLFTKNGSPNIEKYILKRLNPILKVALDHVESTLGQKAVQFWNQTFGPMVDVLQLPHALTNTLQQAGLIVDKSHTAPSATTGNGFHEPRIRSSLLNVPTVTPKSPLPNQQVDSTSSRKRNLDLIRQDSSTEYVSIAPPVVSASQDVMTEMQIEKWNENRKNRNSVATYTTLDRNPSQSQDLVWEEDKTLSPPKRHKSNHESVQQPIHDDEHAHINSMPDSHTDSQMLTESEKAVFHSQAAADGSQAVSNGLNEQANISPNSVQTSDQINPLHNIASLVRSTSFASMSPTDLNRVKQIVDDLSHKLWTEMATRATSS